MLLDNPVKTPTLQETAARAMHRRSKQRRGVKAKSAVIRRMTALPSKGTFAMFEPLHALWAQYMAEVLEPELRANRDIAAKVLTADLHGAILCVTRAKNPSLVGVEGILVQETRNMFKLVTRANKFKSVAKQGCVCTFRLLGHVITIYGSHMRVPGPHRVAKKYKSRATLELS